MVHCPYPEKLSSEARANASVCSVIIRYSSFQKRCLRPRGGKPALVTWPVIVCCPADSANVRAPLSKSVTTCRELCRCARYMLSISLISMTALRIIIPASAITPSRATNHIGVPVSRRMPGRQRKQHTGETL